MTASSLPLSRLLLHAADMVQGVIVGRSLTDLLPGVPVPARPGTQALAFEALRRLGASRFARERLAPKAPPPAIDALLLTALALLWPAGSEAPAYAAHTVVDETVKAARRRAERSAGFVNAVLRRFLREREALVEAAQADPVARHNHPAWWIDRLRADWPGQADALLAAAQRRPPMTLRVNARRGNAAAYAQRLREAGLGARVIGPQAVVLDAPCAVSQLPGFTEGAVSVQDASAQLAAPLLIGAGLRQNQASGGDLPPDGKGGGPRPPRARVLDACAAPGGKTAHLLELADLDVLALDADAQRLPRVAETLDRLGLSATLRAADARDTAAWWDGRPFDAILLDAPCSASGIGRRHPDIRWLRRPGDIAALARVQGELLDALWPLLAPGGRLLYATCSVFRAEGQAVLDAFLQRLPPGVARLDPGSPGHLLGLPDNEAAADSGVAAPPGDGFFYALLHRSSSTPSAGRASAS